MLARTLKPGACALAALLLAGCLDSGVGKGKDLARVSGVVTYNGQPLPAANVTFYVDGADLATGTTDSSGKFTLTTSGRPGAPIGQARVGITKVNAPEGQTTDPSTLTPDDMMRMQMEGGGSTPAEMTPKSAIPEHYGNPQTSNLTATVSSNARENEFEFPLVD